ncbi:hypothetical protein EDI_076790 [Entamoeba dispar SAW760]|uniref:Uncharacterized protein n=1 Tax=Entamoeba dispar (strain ATCC PRA-260 / SAW760) TaxID=370354 RepID=B0EG18_ENTDS|nr:uncharacterized protein EDI_076790 [Entamoeba dispar SAW760]EDR26529.1 hypothetical protein EDI_076790 [Entamoeba dispar SAW760]|eukprot:EDR26529.1 hypothetical protein EDI_076790 [Entamoeba dispar SAW760]
MSCIISRALSRSKKALSTALLVSLIVNEGGRMTFSKSKQSNYALKVLVGKKLVMKETKYDSVSFSKFSQLLCLNLHGLVNDAKLRKERVVTVTKSMLKNEICDESYLPCDRLPSKSSQINECRNREASFSNALAWILLSKGYSLQLGINALKESLKVIHFYVWDSAITPSGRKIVIKEEEFFLKQLINHVQKKQGCTNYSSVSIDRLEVCAFSTRSSYCVFTPVEKSKFSVSYPFNCYSHPFVC